MYLQDKQSYTGYPAAEVRLSISTPASMRWTIKLHVSGQLAENQNIPLMMFHRKVTPRAPLPKIEYTSSYSFPNNPKETGSRTYELPHGFWCVENNSGVPVHIEYKPLSGTTFIEA
ncbi:hypothetical protein HA050_08880 [Iodobacter sp. HSC-16F04]|uniref:Uncharacterized protein n=1 Tax=Iodobacter violaceini TaxID=3044271 RepID=A0ABX0KRE8_9NEIS|nr:hypothetical protein [Iodobacter violacea]NHQ86229.1 hypothetical protein [Iodobacter violacea]